MNLLVTGGAGFIGSNLINMILKKGSKLAINVINLDRLTYAGNLENLQEIHDNPNYRFIKGDIRDRRTVEAIFTKFDIDSVINFAAETHVDRSIRNPEEFITTNITGTHVILDVAMNYWKISPDVWNGKKYKPGTKFIQVSTDEVYGSLSETESFVETSPLAPNNPYSASKASADMIVRAYHQTYGMPVNITRCSNNYGRHQYPDKLIPLMITNCLKDKALPVYGDGLQVRDWVHVSDHCSAIMVVLQKGIPGEIYNIGGNNQKSTIEIVKYIVNTLRKSESLIQYVQDRPSHDVRYAIDYTKITTELGWKPSCSFEQGMQDTIKWYSENCHHWV